MSKKIIRSKEDDFDQLINVISTRLSQGKRVRRKLPGGRIHIDRPLPFLCIYRQLPQDNSKGTERLIMGEASYLVVTGESKFHNHLEKLVGQIVKTLSGMFGGFLIIEIWPTKQIKPHKKEKILKPAFKIITEQSEYSQLTPILSSFYNDLKKIKIHKVSSDVKIDYDKQVHPPKLSQILSDIKLKETKCQLIGLEVSSIYNLEGKNEVYPLVLQHLHRGISRSLKQLCFEFIQNQTTQRPPNYQALGRRAVVKAVWEVDRRLAEISSAFDFLMLITPVNAEEAWIEFKNRQYENTPKFYYRPITVDPPLLKRKLFEIPIEKIEDPTLAYLFREKQAEIAHRLDLLMDRESRSFLFGNLQLYGDVDDGLVQLAKKVLKKLASENSSEKYIDAATFLKQAKQEIDIYKRSYPNLTAKAELRKDIPGVLVVSGNLLVGEKAKVSTIRVNALIQHEIGTHLVTYYNGLSQPLKQLYCGLAGYEELQEGLGLIAEYLTGEFPASRLQTVASRIIAARCLTDGQNFPEAFQTLSNDYNIDQYKAYRILFRIYRGGGSLKDVIYLRGLDKIMKYIQNGGSLELLFVGKFGITHIPLIQELLSREVLHNPIINPRFLSFPKVQQRLDFLRKGIAIHELIERSLS